MVFSQPTLQMSEDGPLYHEPRLRQKKGRTIEHGLTARHKKVMACHGTIIDSDSLSFLHCLGRKKCILSYFILGTAAFGKSHRRRQSDAFVAFPQKALHVAFSHSI